jgi:PAS domain S-box-containing protein
MKQSYKTEIKPAQPSIAIVNAYTVIAAVYCSSFTLIFYSLAGNRFLSAVHLLALISVLANYFILKRTGNFPRATNIILATGTFVVLSLFATGGWDNTGYLWPFAYLPFAFFLSERKNTLFWVIALYAGCIAIAALNFFDIISMPYSATALFNYFTALLVFVICIFLFQKATFNYEEFLGHTYNLLEAGADPFFTIDEDGKITDANKITEKIMGVKREQLVNADFKNYFAEPYKAEEFLSKVIAEGHVHNFPLSVRTADGTIELSLNASLFRDERRGVQKIFAIARDVTEQKKKEETIREANYFLDTVLENIPNMIFVKDARDLRFIRFNKAGEKLLGHSRNDLIGKNDYDFFPKEQADFFTAKDRDVLDRKELLDIPEEPINTPSGQRWLHTKKIPVSDKHGNPLYLLGISEDITGRKKIDEQLRELNSHLEQRVIERTEELNRSEKKYRLLFENNPVPMWILNLETLRFIDVNKAALMHYGYSREEFLSMTGYDIRPEEEKLRFKNLDRSGSSKNYEKGIWKHLKKDGTLIHVEIIAHNILHEGKNVRLVLSNDVTDKIRLEQVSENERKFRNAVLESIHAGVIAIDKNGRIGIINEEVRRMLKLENYPAYPDQIFRNFDVFNADKTKQLKLNELPLMRADKGETVSNFEMIWQNKLTGAKTHLLSNARPIYDQDKKLTGAVTAYLDITGLKNTEEKLKAKVWELDTFIYRSAHDLRGPLTSIMGLIALGKEEVHDEKLDRIMNHLDKSALKLNQVLSDLISVTKITNHKNILVKISLDTLVPALIRQFDKKEGKLPVKYSVDVPEKHQFFCDRFLLKAVLHNIIENSLKYRKSDADDSEIDISVKELNNYVRILVKDNGQGIPQPVQDRIFDMFYKGNKASSGTGLGLYISRVAVEKLGGSVSVSSNYGEGTVVSIYVPALKDQQAT